jgi:hypothetical protein
MQITRLLLMRAGDFLYPFSVSVWLLKPKPFGVIVEFYQGFGFIDW